MPQKLILNIFSDIFALLITFLFDFSYFSRFFFFLHSYISMPHVFEQSLFLSSPLSSLFSNDCKSASRKAMRRFKIGMASNLLLSNSSQTELPKVELESNQTSGVELEPSRVGKVAL